jgi:1-phosphofructokinase
VLQGGVDLLKLSSEELLDEGFAAGDQLSEIVAGAMRLQDAGASSVVISRGADPAILLEQSAHPTLVELATPVFEPLDHRGAGDSMFAASGVGLARGMSARQAVRLGMACGCSERHQARPRNGDAGRDRAARRACHDPISRPARTQS